MIRILRSLSCGFALACVLLALFGLDHGAPAWWLPAAVITAVTTLLLSGIVMSIASAGGSTTRPAPSADAIASAERDGRLQLAKVVDISSTGTRINDDPVAELRLMVASSARAPYSTTTRALIDQVRLPQFQPGNVVVVLQEKADSPAVSLVQSPPQAWRDKAANSTRVRALDHADEWTVQPEKARDARGFLRIPAAVLVLLLVAGFAARLYPVRTEIAEIVAGASPAEVADAQARRAERENSTLNPVRAQEAVDDFVAAAGHSRFTSVDLGSSNATATVPTTPGAGTTNDLRWSDGEVTDREPSSIQPGDSELPLLTFDAADVDWAMLQGLADRLPGQAGFEPEYAPNVVVRVPVRMFNEAGVPYEILVSASGPYDSASVTYGPDGEVIRMHGGAEGSEIAERDAADG